LAGITAAEIPAKQQVSGETQLILSAIGSLERRVNGIENKGKANARFFTTEDEMVTFQDNSTAEINEEIFNQAAELVGILVDIHPADEKIFIKQEDGKIIPYAANSVRSKGLSSFPF
jgi:hypothetical protein